MPAAVIAPYIIAALGVSATGFAAAAIIFGTRLVTTYVISNLFLKQQGQGGAGSNPAEGGTRVQVPPATNNKLNVAYGTTWLKPTITDAKISTDQKTMWYVCSLCESHTIASGSLGGGTIAFGDIYWADKRLVFDTTDPTKVVSWFTPDGKEDKAVNGLINVYCYNKGSYGYTRGNTKDAITVMSDSGIASSEHWTSTDTMTNTCFMIVKVQYKQDIGLTGLETLTAQINSTLSAPGDVVYDYLTNTYYGCAVPSTDIDTSSLHDLNAYSSQTITYTKADNTTGTQLRYLINGVIDTNTNCFENLQTIMDSCDSWLQWNETTGKWGVVINKAYDQSAGSQAAKSITDLFNLTDDNIIGAINLNPVDLNSTLNRYEVTYPDTYIYDQSGYAYGDLEYAQKNPNEPNNLLSLKLPLVNNNVQAQYLAKRKLFQSREDLIVQCAVDYSGILVNAGDLIRFNSDKFQWNNKVFRVTQVQESKSADGFLGAQLTLCEYNTLVYQNISIKQFIPSPNTGISDPSITEAPDAPTVTNKTQINNIPYFTLNAYVPPNGVYKSMEFWYSSGGTSLDNFKLLTTETSTGTSFASGELVTSEVSGLTDDTYYFRVRVLTTNGKWSDFSDAGDALPWTPSVNVPSALGTNLEFDPAVTICPSSSDGTTTTVGQVVALHLRIGQAITPLWNQVGTQPNDTWYGTTVSASTGLSISSLVVDQANDRLYTTITAIGNTTSQAKITFSNLYYKSKTGVVTGLGSASCSVTKLNSGVEGPPGSDGYVITSPSLYKWAMTEPTEPTGTSTLTWSTLTNTNYTGTDSWSASIPTNPGTSAISLWAATKTISAPLNTAVSSVDWSTGSGIASIGKNGNDGTPGNDAISVGLSQNQVDIRQNLDGTWSPATTNLSVTYVGEQVYTASVPISVRSNNIFYGVVTGNSEVSVSGSGAGGKTGNVTFSINVTGTTLTQNVPVNMYVSTVSASVVPNNISIYQNLDGTWTPNVVNCAVTYSNTTANITKTIPVTVTSNNLSYGNATGNSLVTVATTGTGTKVGNITFDLPYGFSNNQLLVPVNMVGLNVTANASPSYVSYPQLANGKYTSPNAQSIVASFKDVRTGNTANITLTSNVTANGNVTVTGANANNIVFTYIDSGSSGVAEVRHVPSGATSTIEVYAQIYPVVITNQYGGADVQVSGITTTSISSALNVSHSYSAGQTFNKAVNDGAWTPTPNVSNIIKTTDTFSVSRADVVVGSYGYDVLFNTATDTFTLVSNSTGATNSNRFSFGSAQVSSTRAYLPITYTDPEGTITSAVEVNVLKSGSRGNAGPVNVTRYGRFDSRDQAQLIGSPVTTTGLNTYWTRTPDSFPADDPFTHTTSQYCPNVTIGSPAQWRLSMTGKGGGQYLAAAKEQYTITIDNNNYTSYYNNELFRFTMGGVSGGYVLNSPANATMRNITKVGSRYYMMMNYNVVYTSTDMNNWTDVSSYFPATGTTQFILVTANNKLICFIFDGFNPTLTYIGTSHLDLVKYDSLADYGYWYDTSAEYLRETSSGTPVYTDLIVSNSVTPSSTVRVCPSGSDPAVAANWTQIPQFTGMLTGSTSGSLAAKFYKINNKIFAVTATSIFRCDSWGDGWSIVYAGSVYDFVCNGATGIWQTDINGNNGTVYRIGSNNGASQVATYAGIQFLAYYNNTFFIHYSDSSTSQFVITSTDAVNWSSPVTGSGYSRATLYSGPYGMYLAGSKIYRSTNLTSFTDTGWSSGFANGLTRWRNSADLFWSQSKVSSDGQNHLEVSFITNDASKITVGGVGGTISVSLQYFDDVAATVSKTWNAVIKLDGNLTTADAVTANFVSKFNTAKGSLPFTASAQFGTRVTITFTYNGDVSSSAASFTITQSSGSPVSTISITPWNYTDVQGMNPSYIEFANVEIASNRSQLIITNSGTHTGNVYTWNVTEQTTTGTLAHGDGVILDIQSVLTGTVTEFNAQLAATASGTGIRYNTGATTISIDTGGFDLATKTAIQQLTTNDYIFVQGTNTSVGNTVMMFRAHGSAYDQAADIATMFNTQEVAYTASATNNIVTITSSNYVNRDDLSIISVGAGSDGSIGIGDFSLVKVTDGREPYTVSSGTKSYLTFNGSSGGGRFTSPVVVDIDYGTFANANTSLSSDSTTLAKIKTQLAARGYYVFDIGTSGELRIVDIEPTSGGTLSVAVTSGTGPTGNASATITQLDLGTAEIVVGDQYRWTYPVNTGKQIT
jgi:hypothetical protein